MTPNDPRDDSDANADVDLSALDRALSDDGLSLDQLSEAFAEMLRTGDDPYQASAPAAVDDAGIAHAEVVAAAVSADHDEHDACEITPRSILEAMLFVGRADNAPLAAADVAALMRGVRPDEIDQLVVELNAAYEVNGRPYEIVSQGPGYRLVLRDDYSAVREQFYGRLREVRLSQPAIDILAIVAYHQPVTAEDVAKLRGKPSGAILSQLVRRELLQLERPEESSRRVEYSTTRRFLEFFGIASLDELPRPQDVERN